MKNEKIVLTKEQESFLNGNLWKVVIKMMIPTIIMMLFFGAYVFSDTIISIHFANDSYKDVLDQNGQVVMSSSDQVRTFMGAIAPINMLIMGIVFMVATGVATRVAINQGAKKHIKALDTLKTGTTISVIFSLIMIPILWFASKPWMEAMVENEQQKAFISENGFDYAWPLIIGLPFQLFSQLLTSLFRNEGRNKEMMNAMIAPIFINLGLDMILMGPANMNITGGALATVISSIASILIFTFYIFKHKESTLIKFKNLFGFKLKYITLIGVALVGMGAFWSNFGQSFTVTIESRTLQQVSESTYASDVIHAGMTAKEIALAKSQASLIMFTQLQTLMPIFMLVFPAAFALADAAKPIAAFNFGAGKIKRTKKVAFITLIYAFFSGIVLYLFIAFVFRTPLFASLSVYDNAAFPTMLDDTKFALWVMMSVLPVISPMIGAQVWFGATDKILGNVIVSSLWAIMTIPFLFIFKEIALNSDSNNYIFWALYPGVGATSGLIAFAWAGISMHFHKEKNLNIEEKIIVAQKILKSPLKTRKIIQMARDKKNA